MSEYITRPRRSKYRLLPHWVTAKKVILVVLVLVVGSTGAYGWSLVSSLSKITGKNPLSIIQGITGIGDQSQIAQQLQNHQRVNIALFGYGGSGHDGAFLTDSIMVVSMQQPEGHPLQIAQTSIPRDWYVPIKTNSATHFGRINEVFQDGYNQAGNVDEQAKEQAGGNLASAELEQLLGIKITRWVGVDFTAFKDVVDNVGGVDVNVPDTFTDNQYPAGECNFQPGANCRLETVHFVAGQQHMDGARALIFARSRHATNSVEATDFARSRRQQLIIASLKAKVQGFNVLVDAPKILNSLGNNVATNLSDVQDIKALYDATKGVDTSTLAHLSIDDQNFLYECGYPNNCAAAYLYAHDNSYTSLQQYIQNALVDPDALAEKAPVTVVDGSGKGLGAATRWSSLLNQLHLNATDGGPTRLSISTQVIDNSGGKYTKTAQWLAKYFGTTVTAEQTPTANSSSTGGVTVILGQSEESAFNNRSGPGNVSGSTSSSSSSVYSNQVPATPRRRTSGPR